MILLFRILFSLDDITEVVRFFFQDWRQPCFIFLRSKTVSKLTGHGVCEIILIEVLLEEYLEALFLLSPGYHLHIDFFDLAMDLVLPYEQFEKSYLNIHLLIKPQPLDQSIILPHQLLDILFHKIRFFNDRLHEL